MSYEEKLVQSAEIVDDAAVFEAFRTKLAEEGYKSVEDLETLTWEELEAMGLKRPKAKRVAAVFRAKVQKDEHDTAYVTEKAAKRMARRELLRNYDPSDSESAVYNRLSQMASGQPCIVFNPDRTVDVEASDACLEDIRMGLPARRQYVTKDGSCRIVHRVGDRPDQYLDEDPLYPQKPLRSDGTSVVTGRSWVGIDRETRILMSLAVVTGELRITAPQDAHEAMDLAQRVSVNGLRVRYQRAAAKYEELSATGSLPALKIRIGSASQTADPVKPNDPFAVNGDGHRRY